MHSRAHFLRLMTLFVASASSVALAGACGGKALGESSSGSSGTTDDQPNLGKKPVPNGSSGTSGSSGKTYPECGPFKTTTFSVDATKCEPQLASSTACGSEVCQWNVDIPCDATDGGPLDPSDAEAEAGDGGVPSDIERCAPCMKLAPPNRQNDIITYCYERVDDAGVRHLSCSGCGVGRPPRGFVASRVVASSIEAERLAEMAQLEAASVHAFSALYTDLARHGAPVDLLREVRASAADEVRHARAMTRVATRHGANVPDVAALPARARSIEELAIENAEEGCVNETYGAALALIQAESATDVRFRALMKRIAKDELRHAALSWEIAAWLDARLDDDARGRVAAARERAVAVLEESLGDGAALPKIGVPSSAVAREIFATMRAHLASGALPAVA